MKIGRDKGDNEKIQAKGEKKKQRHEIMDFSCLTEGIFKYPASYILIIEVY